MNIILLGSSGYENRLEGALARSPFNRETDDAVAKIIADVMVRGDEALVDYLEKFDMSG